MARRLCIQFTGAIYHVTNRGDFRRDLFWSAGEAGVFLSVLEEAVETFGCTLHAYLQQVAANPPKQKQQGFTKMSRS